MSDVVLDASAVAFLLGSSAAGRIPFDRRWLAPSFVDVEFSNVLWKRVAFSGTSRSKAEEIWKAFRDLPIDRTPDESLLDEPESSKHKGEQELTRCRMGDRSVNKNGRRAVERRTFLRRMVRVKKGGLIEIRSSRLKAGENAEVVVRVSPGPSDGPYDFSDLAGKLKWKGDAVAAQRRIRDEW